MGCIRNIKTGAKLRNAQCVIKAVQKIKNWPLYFADFFSLSPRKFHIFYLQNGLKIFTRARSTDRAILTSVYLSDEYEIARYSFGSNATVIDIGANIGVFSLLAARKAQTVYAFEAVDDNFEMLKKNITMNNLSHIINPFPLAVSGKKEKIKIFLLDDQHACHSIYGKGTHYTEVDSITLQNIFDTHNIAQCSLLKIDAEGAEYDIIYSLPDRYFKRIEKIFVEYHDLNVPQFKKAPLTHTPENLKDFLQSKGFKITEKLFCYFAENLHAVPNE